MKVFYRFNRLVPIMLLLLFTLVAAGCNRLSRPEELTVSAAISLKDALADAAKDFKDSDPAFSIAFNLGSSGDLAQQIKRGAPVDVFISAGKEEMDQLVQNEAILKETLTSIASNELVLVRPANSDFPSGWLDLADPRVKGIAMGDPSTVPAGRYGQQVLAAMELWPVVRPKVIFTRDVRQALSYVQAGNVDAALVYRTDALSAGQAISLAASASPGSHDPVAYPAAVIAFSRHQPLARRWLSYLQSPEGQSILARYGFDAPHQE